MALGSEGEQPGYVIKASHGIVKIIFDTGGDILNIKETTEKPTPMQELRKDYAGMVKHAKHMIEINSNPEWMKELLKIQRKVMDELERQAAHKSPHNPDNLAHLRGVPFHLKRRILLSTDCTQRIIKENCDQGIEIDEQLLARAHSKCGETKDAARRDSIDKIRAKMIKALGHKKAEKLKNPEQYRHQFPYQSYPEA